MSEQALPERPDAGQLRRMAKELRAAAARVTSIISDAQDGGRLRPRVVPVIGATPGEAPDQRETAPGRHDRQPPTAQNTVLCAPKPMNAEKPPASQIGGSACGYQPGFALPALQETANVRVADPYLCIDALVMNVRTCRRQLLAWRFFRGGAQHPDGHQRP